MNSKRNCFTDEVIKTLLAMRLAGHTLPELQNWFEQKTGKTIGKSTLYNYLARWNDDFRASIAPEQQLNIDRKVEAASAEASHYRKLYQAAVKEAATSDKMVAAIQEVSKAIQPVRMLAKARIGIAESEQVAIAPLCDTHIGERVDLKQMAGLNEYDIDIFNARLYGWAETIIKLVNLRQKYANISTLVVPLLGDMVSGDIHADMTRTNIDNIVNRVGRGAYLVAQSLLFLSQYFERIFVPCVVGNHGRLYEKPPAKDKYVDWDYMLFQWVAVFCKEQKNISFSVPQSFMHAFSIVGKNILMIHGDSIKSWQSIPYYGIVRAISQLRQVFQFRKGLEEDVLKNLQQGVVGEDFLDVLAPYFDSVLLGHFHRHDEIDIGTGEAIVCGCMKGGDEYALGKLHNFSRPKQIITYWHPKYGYLGKDIIYLEGFNRSSEKFIDTLPEVWIEGRNGNT